MFYVKIITSEGCIRLDSAGLSIWQGDAYAYLTAQEYMWLPEYYAFGEELIITSEGGTATLRPHIAGALTCLIAGIPRA